MKKIVWYLVLAALIIGGLTYALGEAGLLGGILGALGVGGTTGLNKLKEKAAKLDQEAADIKEEIKELDKIEKDTEDKTPEEETEYWKNQ